MIGEFETPRLRLRPLSVDDAGLLAGLDGDAEVMRYLTGRASSAEEIRAGLQSALGTRWLAFDRAAGRFLGWVSAIPAGGGEYDVGWRFRRSAWGRGYATEGARALVDALFEQGARRVFAQTMTVNERSQAVMRRLGLRYVRTFHLEFDDPLPGTELGEVEYELTRAEWEARRPR